MADWKPGMRHQVRRDFGYDLKQEVYLWWRCVDCGQWFETWPSDAEACPGPTQEAG